MAEQQRLEQSVEHEAPVTTARGRKHPEEGEPYLRSHFASRLRQSGTAPGGLVFGRNATRFATTLATRAVFGRTLPKLSQSSLTVAVVILHAREHWRYDHAGKIPAIPPVLASSRTNDSPAPASLDKPMSGREYQPPGGFSPTLNRRFP